MTQISTLSEMLRMVQLPAFRLGSSHIVNSSVREVLDTFLSNPDNFAEPVLSAEAAQATTVTQYLDLLESARKGWQRAKRECFHANFGSEFTSGTYPTLFASTVMVRICQCAAVAKCD